MRCRARTAGGSFIEVELTAQRTGGSGSTGTVRMIPAADRPSVGAGLRDAGYPALFEANPLPMWVFDEDDLSVIDVNSAALNMYGYSKSEFLALNVKELRPEEEVPKLLGVLKNTEGENGSIGIGTFTHRKKNGDLIQVNIHAARVEVGDGRECVLVSCTDVADLLSIAGLTGLRSVAEDVFQRPELSCSAVVDRAGSFVFADQRFAEKLAASPDGDALLGVPFENFVCKWHIERFRKAIADCIALKGSRIQIELDHPAIDRVFRTFVWEFTAIVHAGSTEVRAAGLDVSDRAAFQKALVESNMRFEHISRASEGVIIDWDISENRLISGAGIGLILEMQEGTGPAVASEWEELLHPDDCERITESMSKFIASGGGEKWKETFRIRRKDQTYAYVEINAGALRDKAGQAVRLIGVAADITLRKRREDYLRLVESVVKTTNDAVILAEAQPLGEDSPKVLFVNEACCSVTGYPVQELVGSPLRCFEGPATKYADVEALRETLRKAEPCELTMLSYKKDGTRFWNKVSLKPVKDKAGWHTHWVVISTDVSLQMNNEFEKQLVSEISRIFNREESLVGCLDEMCGYLAEFGEFSFAEVWLPGSSGEELHLVSSHFGDERGSEFYESSRSVRSFKKGEGLPGAVYEHKKPALWDRIDRKDAFVRKKAARKSGMISAFGLPLRDNGEVNGVLVVGTSEDETQLSFRAETLNKLDAFIGAEVSRKKLENELNQFFNSVEDMICIVGFDGYVKKVNPACVRILGYSPEELQSKPFMEFVHPDDRERTGTELEKQFSGISAINFENRYIAKSGQVKWLSWTTTPMPEQNIMHAVAKDVTDQKDFEKLSADAAKMARMGIWEVDLINDVLFWSPVTCEIHGEVPGYRPDFNEAVNYFREDFRETVRDCIARAIEIGEPYDFEAILVTKRGEECWVRSVGRPEHVEGKCVRLFGSFQDIHQRKESELRLKNTADNLPGVLFQYHLMPDGTDRVTYVSKGSEKIWGLTPEECIEDISRVWGQIEAGGDREVLRAAIDASARTLQPWNVQWRSLRPDGELRRHEGYGTPYKMADGTLIWDVLIMDITEKRELEALLRRTNEIARIGAWEAEMREGKKDTFYWSPLAREILNIDEDETPTIEDALGLLVPESKKAIRAAVKKLIAKGEKFDLQLLLVTREENERWVRCIGEADFFNGKCTKVFGSFQDIHAMKLTELNLKVGLKALEDYKFAIDQSAIVAITDKNGVILSVNDYFCALSKYDREELIGKTHKLINSGHHPKSFFADLWSTISSGRVWRGEIKNRAKDGTYYWVDSTIVPFLNDEGKPFQYLAIRFDMTDRKAAEHDLMDALEEKNTVLESIGDGFFAVDSNLTVKYWNNRAERIFGIKRADIIDKNFRAVHADAVDSQFYHKFHRAVNSGEQRVFEAYYEVLDIWLDVSVYPGDSGYSVYFKDSTDRKNAELEMLKFKMIIENTRDGSPSPITAGLRSISTPACPKRWDTVFNR